MREPLTIVVTDTHLSESTIDVNYKIYAQVLSLAKQMGIGTVCHAGDIFTSRKGQPEVVLNAFKSILDLFDQEQVKMIAIPGNHDKVSYVSESSYLIPFTNHPAFNLLSQGGQLVEGAVAIHFIPYFDEKLMYAKYIPSVDRTLYNILITHCAINGVRTNSGVKVADELSPDLFKQFDLVLVGHYHDRQEVSPKIVYIGSAYQANFGEDPFKGCVIIYNDGSYEFVNLDFPKYITVEYSTEEITTKSVKEISKLKSAGDNVRVKVKGKITSERQPIIEQLDSIGVRVEVASEQATALDTGPAQTQLSSLDIIEGFDQWVKQKNIQDSEYGKKILSKVL